MALELKNPHSVLAALKTRPIDVTEIRLTAGASQGNWGDVADEARSHGIPVVVRKAPPQKMKRRQSEDQGRRTAGSVALVKPRIPSSLSELFALDKSEGESRGLWLALDCIQDPHNIGAIFRTAGFFGVRGVILTKDRSDEYTFMYKGNKIQYTVKETIDYQGNSMDLCFTTLSGIQACL